MENDRQRAQTPGPAINLDYAGSAVTVLTAGANQKTGETRLDLVKKNAAIFSETIPGVARHNPDGIGAAQTCRGIAPASWQRLRAGSTTT